MIDLPEHLFADTMRRAALIAHAMLPAATRGTAALQDEAELLTRPQTDAALLLLVALHQRRANATGVHATIDDPTIDTLQAAADEGLPELRDAVLALDDQDARGAVVELLSLYRDLIAIELHARVAAQTN